MGKATPAFLSGRNEESLDWYIINEVSLSSRNLICSSSQILTNFRFSEPFQYFLPKLQTNQFFISMKTSQQHLPEGRRKSKIKLWRRKLTEPNKKRGSHFFFSFFFFFIYKIASSSVASS